MTGVSACSADRYNSSPLWGKRNGDATSGWGKVMHAEFDLGSTQMDASDPPFRVINDGAVRLMIRLDSKEEVLKAVETLSEGGTVITSLSPKESRYLLPDQLRLYRRHNSWRRFGTGCLYFVPLRTVQFDSQRKSPHPSKLSVLTATSPRLSYGRLKNRKSFFSSSFLLPIAHSRKCQWDRQESKRIVPLTPRIFTGIENFRYFSFKFYRRNIHAQKAHRYA